MSDSHLNELGPDQSNASTQAEMNDETICSYNPPNDHWRNEDTKRRIVIWIDKMPFSSKQNIVTNSNAIRNKLAIQC